MFASSPASGWPGPDDGHRRHQRAARGPQAIGRAGPEYHCLPVAIVLDLPEKVCQERNAAARPGLRPACRPQPELPIAAVAPGLRKEGFRHVFVLETPEEVEAATVEREPLWNNRQDEHGPFDIIGDVHGCCDELEELLGGSATPCRAWTATIPHWDTGPTPIRGRKAVFLGDLVDRGPRILTWCGWSDMVDLGRPSASPVTTT